MKDGGELVRQRIRSIWYDLGDTLWFVPALMTTAAIGLAVLMLSLDRALLDGDDIGAWWLFEGGAEGARGVLTTIAGTMITVATTAFSITIVALQLGSSQFSPRIVRGFTGDRGNQLVLGIFIATFAYTIIVLRSIRSELSDQERFVPSASVTLAILLAFAAIGSLIYFFHHATRMIQASVVIERAAQDTFVQIGRHLDQQDNQDVAESDEPIDRAGVHGISLDRCGYISHIDRASLAKLGGEHRTVLTVSVQIGMHVLSNTPVVTIVMETWHRMDEDDRRKLESGVRDGIETGMERTVEGDLLLGFRQLSDIAIKALSPGINDPTTAIIAIDSLGEALLRVRDLTTDIRYHAAADGHGGVRVLTIGLEQVLDECLPQVRHYGAGDVVVISHLLRVLEGVRDGAPACSREVLAQQGRLVIEESVMTLALPADAAQVRRAGAWTHPSAG